MVMVRGKIRVRVRVRVRIRIGITNPFTLFKISNLWNNKPSEERNVTPIFNVCVVAECVMHLEEAETSYYITYRNPSIALTQANYSMTQFIFDS